MGVPPDCENFVMAWLQCSRIAQPRLYLQVCYPRVVFLGEIGEIWLRASQANRIVCTRCIGRAAGTAAGYGEVDSDETALLPGHE